MQYTLSVEKFPNGRICIPLWSQKSIPQNLSVFNFLSLLKFSGFIHKTEYPVHVKLELGHFFQNRKKLENQFVNFIALLCTCDILLVPPEIPMFLQIWTEIPLELESKDLFLPSGEVLQVFWNSVHRFIWLLKSHSGHGDPLRKFKLDYTAWL